MKAEPQTQAPATCATSNRRSLLGLSDSEGAIAGLPDASWGMEGLRTKVSPTHGFTASASRSLAAHFE